MFKLSKRSGAAPAAGPDEDLECIAGVLKGDIETYSFIVRKYQKKMLNTAFRMTGDYEDSCDIVQDSFIAAYKALAAFRGEASFQTWLTGIVINHTRNRLRQKKGRESVTVSLAGPDGGVGDCREPAAQDRSAFEELDRKEMREGLEYCIATLNEEFREVLVLRDVQQYSYEEISGALGLPDGTVKSRISRAREALKECLRKKLGRF